MSQNTAQLAHGLLLSVGNQNQSRGSALRVGRVAAVEAASLELHDLVLLQVLARVVHNHRVLRFTARSYTER